MTTETTTVALRPCCGDARERHGAASPMFGEEIGHLFGDDAAVAPIIVETHRSISAARHEAGHALVAMALGGSVGRVMIDGQPLAVCRLPDAAPWRHRIAFDLGGDGAGWGSLPEAELKWHLESVRKCGGGLCDRCRAVRSITVSLAHPPDDVVIDEFRRIEAAVAEFFADPIVRILVADLAWTLADEGTLTGDEIMDRFGSQIRALKFNI